MNGDPTVAEAEEVPEPDCPPVDSSDADGPVYRCCKNSPPAEREMKTAAEADRLPDADPCIRQALSVFQTQEDAVHQIHLFRRWRRKLIARATLKPEHGRVKLTKGKQPSHTSWWPAGTLDLGARAGLFSVIAEVEK